MKGTRSIRLAGPETPKEPPRDLEAHLRGIEAELSSLAGDRPPKVLAEFARAFFFGTPLPYFAGRSDAELAADMVAAFDFVDGRKTGDIRVRVMDSPRGFGIVQATMRDQPFLLDSARESLHAEGVSIHRYLHPILRTERDAGGQLKSVRPRPEPGTAESFLHFEVEPLTDPALRARVEKTVTEALREAAVASEDYPQIRAAVESVTRNLLAERPPDDALRSELEECADFLHWLLRGNFILLGYRSYDFHEERGERFVVVTPRSGLGILSNPVGSNYYRPVPFSKLDPELHSRMLQPIFPLVSKTNREGRVHRRARMDYIGIKKLSPVGQVTGEHRILGFFTSQALNQIGSEIPVLRRKLARILGEAQVLEGSHDYKEIVTIFNSLPKA